MPRIVNDEREHFDYVPEAYGIRDGRKEAKTLVAGCAGCQADLQKDPKGDEKGVSADDLCTIAGHADARADVRRPLYLELRWLSSQEYRSFTRQIVMKQKGQNIQGKNTEEVNEKIIQAATHAVHGYFRKVRKPDGSFESIAVTNGALLARYGEADLVNEVLGVVTDISKLEEGQLDR